MNQAMNRGLRQHALLLLVPLLVASTPSPSAVPLPVAAGPAHHLTLTAPLGPVIAGVPVPVTVVARDHGDTIATDFRGTIHFDTDAEAVELPQNYTFTALDAGQKTFFITYKRVGPPKDLLIVDISGQVIGVRIPNVPVQAGPARKFQFDKVPVSTQAGTTIPNIMVYALDEFDNWTSYTGSVRFTSNDPQAQLPSEGPLQNSYSVTFKSADLGRTLVVTATEDTRITGGATIAVFPGPFKGVRMTPSATSLEACEEVTLYLRAMDAFGNIVGGSRNVKHCVDADLPVTRTRTEIIVDEEAGNCILGHLPLSGVARMGWKSSVGQEVDFTLEDSEWNTQTRISWEEAWPSAQCSNLLVRLSVRPKKEGTVAEPGGLVEFLAELANEGQDTVPAGMLRLLPNGLTVLEARLDDQLLTRSGDGFALPGLPPGMTQSVQLTAQASAQLDPPASAEVWYTTLDGVNLTPKQTVSFKREAPGVDVGCGCQAGDLPGQLGSWLLLLLAVSRPTERFRRLKRGERTYR